MAPNSADRPIDVMEQGSATKVLVDAVNKTINSTPYRGNFLAADWFPRGEMAEGQ